MVFLVLCTVAVLCCLFIYIFWLDAGLRERLNKIMASDYFTTTPEMKAPVEVAAAGNYASFQVPVMEDGSVAQYQQQVYLSCRFTF